VLAAIDVILTWAATWGLLGAFCYAGPRWSLCAFATRGVAGRCTLDAVVSLMVGTIAAGAACNAAMLAFDLREDYRNSVAAFIGLMANPTAPVLIRTGPMMARVLRRVALSAISDKFARLLMGEDEDARKP